MPTDLAQLMHRNLMEVFGQRDAAKRRGAIAELYAEDCLCVDHKEEVRGHDALQHKIDLLHAKFPDFVFAPRRPAETHHNIGRLHWGFGPAGQPARITGLDIALFDGAEISRLYVFLDPVPALS